MRKALTSLDAGLEWTNGKRLCDLDYADDIVLLDSSVERMRKLTEGVEDEGRKVGLCMNVSKCKVMVSNNYNDSTDVKIGSSVVEVVEDFCYLGSLLSSNSNCDKDCQTRIGKAASVFGRLKAVWKNKYISFPVKVKLYESLVMSTLL